MSIQSPVPSGSLAQAEIEGEAVPALSEVSAGEGLGAPPRRKVSRVALGATFILLTVAVVGPILAPEPSKADLRARLQPPVGFGGTWAHTLGTDGLGRDMLAQLVAGTRVSLLVGLGAAALAALIGIPLGLVAGYHGGRIDSSISWVVDLQIGFPAALVILLIAAYVEAGLVPLIITLGVVSWMLFTRLSRSLALSLKESDFVAASKLAGSSTTKILRRHLLPNMMSPLMTLFLLQVATAMLGESALSYLGFGISRPDVSWGLMIAEGQEYLRIAWWVVILPGALLAGSVLVFHGLSRSRAPRKAPVREPT